MARTAPTAPLPTLSVTPPLPETDFQLEHVPIADLHPHPRNDGRHPPEELAHLKQSILTHNVYRNVVIAQDGTILAGHGVVQAAQELGHTHIAVRRMPYAPDDPAALQVLVGDNHIARLRHQNDEMLATVLQDLQAIDVRLLLGTGYDETSLQALLQSQTTPEFLPVGIEEQGQLDQLKLITCPQCGAEFHP